MQKDAIREKITSQFHQSLADSGVEVTAIPSNQLQAIVNALSDGINSAFEAVMESDEQVNNFSMSAGNNGLESMSRNMNVSQNDPPEKILWTGRPYMTLGTRYELTTQRLRIFRGILGKTLDEIELVRMRDTSISQHIGERALKVGDVTIVSNDPTTPEIILENIKDPLGVREMIRKAMLEEKERRGLHYREEM